MKRLLAISVLTLGILGIAVSPLVARAAQNTATLDVTAKVVGRCTIADALTTNGLVFTDYDGSAAATASLGLQVTCTKNTSYWIGMGYGQNGDATAKTRALGNGTDTLAYQLCHTANCPAGSGWTDDNPGTTTTADQPGLYTYTVWLYGLIPAGTYGLSLGTYTDQVTMDVNF